MEIKSKKQIDKLSPEDAVAYIEQLHNEILTAESAAEEKDKELGNLQKDLAKLQSDAEGHAKVISEKDAELEKLQEENDKLAETVEGHAGIIATIQKEKAQLEKLTGDLSVKLEKQMTRKTNRETIDYKDETYVIRLNTCKIGVDVIKVSAEGLQKNPALVERILAVKGQQVLQKLDSRPDAKKKK